MADDIYSTMVEPETQTFEEHVAGMQNMINDGSIWMFQGSAGREAIHLLKAGYCTLGDEPHKDYWGNTVPSKTMVAPGSVGTDEFMQRMNKNG